MGNNKKETLYEKTIRKLKNNPIVVAILIVATIVVALSQGLDIFNKFKATVSPKERHCVYAGKAQTDAEAITWLIESEAEAVLTEDMGLIKEIFTENAIIVDLAANGGTPHKWINPIDRYEPLFEDYDFLVAENTHIKAIGPINNDTVEYISGSLGNFTDKGIPGEYKNRDDSSHWTAKKIDGCWKIIRFEFNK